MRNSRGSVNVLAGKSDLQGALQETSVPNLKVLSVGSVPPNPAELLGSNRFSALLGRVREEFDYVLLDAPPVRLVSDPVILAALADGVLFVVDSQATDRTALLQSMRELQGVGARVLGTVMNNRGPEAGTITNMATAMGRAYGS